jgi:hypothetical protein
MTVNFKNDSSFFTYVRYPFSYLGTEEIRYWFECIAPKIASYRIIIDKELDDRKISLKILEENYPGTKVIGVVMNPWARLRLAYLNLRENKDSRANCSFNGFIKFISNKVDRTKLNALSPQIDWLSHTAEDGSLKEADYIFKVENLDEEFKVIREYFDCYEPLKWFHPIPEYREHYNEESRLIVSEMFAKDIERFGYEF